MLYCHFIELIAQSNIRWPVSVRWQYLSGDRNTKNPTGPNINTEVSSSLIFEPALYSDEQTYSCTAKAMMLGLYEAIELKQLDFPLTLGKTCFL